MTHDRNLAGSCIGDNDEMLDFTSKSTNRLHVEMIAASLCWEDGCNFSQASVDRIRARSRLSVDNVSVVEVVVVFAVAFAGVQGKEDVVLDPQHIAH